MWIATVNKPDCPAYSYHQYLWSYFPECEEQNRPFLFRVLDSSILLLSRHKPATASALDISGRIVAGNVYQFDVLASPRNGHNTKTPGPYKYRFIRGNDAVRDWFGRRLSGAEPSFVQVFDRPDLRMKKADGREIVRPQTIVRGAVRVTDPAAFIDCALSGIGGGGAWGFGLMVLPEVMTWS